MKKNVKVTAVMTVAMLVLSANCFAWTITGGTAKNTNERQQQQTNRNDKQWKPQVSQETLNAGKVVVNKLFPITGTAEDLLDGMEWAADRQREIGGVPPTGSTVKRTR